MFFMAGVGEVSVLLGCDAASLVVSRRSKDLMDLGTLKMTPLNCLETPGLKLTLHLAENTRHAS